MNELCFTAVVLTLNKSLTIDPQSLWIWSHLLNKSLMKNFIFCALKNK